MAQIPKNARTIPLTGFQPEPSLAAKLESLEAKDRVKDARIAHLESVIEQLIYGDPDGLNQDISSAVCDETANGRPLLKSRWWIVHDRDRILDFSQLHWSTISDALSASNSPHDFTVTLEKIFHPVWQSNQGLQMLIARADKGWEFLKGSDRYHGAAIELASALAGADFMKPRSSFDFFLGKQNRASFLARHPAEMELRRRRIAKGKNRKTKLMVTQNANDLIGRVEAGSA